MKRDLDIFSGMLSNGYVGPDITTPTTINCQVPEFAPDFDEYWRIVLFSSGGKDSNACLLHLLELGVDKAKIELHHHRVDGNEGSHLMDWPCTDAFMQALADAFRIPLYFSWREGGFEREMLRENCGTAPIIFTRGDGSLVRIGGERSRDSTRRKFPQVSASLMVRWCSASLKGDVGSRLLNNDPRFNEGKTLVITGERAEESANRARYQRFEPHRNDNRNGRNPRWIDHWRPVHGWTEQEVWDIARRNSLAVHPAYHLGFSRASCMHCVFLGSDQWATAYSIAPERVKRIADYESEFGVTIHRTRSVWDQISRGTAFPVDPFWRDIALSDKYTLPIFLDQWVLPAGAFGSGCGPT